MSVRNNLLGGTDWSDGEVLYAVDLNDTFNATIGLSVFGTEYNYAEDPTQSAIISSGTYDEKLRLDVNVPEGDYHVAVYFDYSTSDRLNPMLFRAQVDDTVTFFEISPTMNQRYDDGVWCSASVFSKVHLTAGAHHIDIDYGNSSNSVTYIRNARIELWRVA